MNDALLSFGIDVDSVSTSIIGDGLINDTWKVHSAGVCYVLQRVNHKVFKQPDLIDKNLRQIADYISNSSPSYLFTAPLPSTEGKTLVCADNQYFRLFKFVVDSVCYNAIDDPKLAYEAAKQFGLFTFTLSGFPVDKLSYTIPDFHNLPLRFEAFVSAVRAYQYPDRMELADTAIKIANKYKPLVDTYTHEILGKVDFVKRVCHHDTKISNVLFGTDNQGLCVIDLDTVMPGYYISDIGDMFRTYLCADSEEAVLDLANITDTHRIRLDYFRAIVSGYLFSMKTLLSNTEKKYIIYAGKYMIYMQAVRFLTDFLNGDVYYKVSHPLHNYNRAVNQLVLLEEYCARENQLRAIVDSALE